MKKPNIEDVYRVFVDFQNACGRAARNALYPRAEIERAREACKVALMELGIAQHIDWTNKEE